MKYFLRYPYFWYISVISVGMGILLFLFGWKKKIILVNWKICGLPPKKFGFLKFYFFLSRDLFLFLHGTPIRKIKIRTRDTNKLQSLKNSGGVLCAAHFHNWELMGSWLIKNRLHLLSIATPFSNKKGGKFLQFFRKRTSVPVIFNNVSKKALNWIEQKGTFGIILDQ